MIYLILIMKLVCVFNLVFFLDICLQEFFKKSFFHKTLIQMFPVVESYFMFVLIAMFLGATFFILQHQF